MNYQVKRQASRRIADYFIIIGPTDRLVCCRDQVSKSLNELKFKAYVSDRYPVTDRPNAPLPDGLALFCFPNGISITSSVAIPTFHSFVLTSEEGNRSLGSCLTFYEELTPKQYQSYREALSEICSDSEALNEHLWGKKFFAPTCLCIVSNWTFVSSFKKLLCGLFEITLAPSMIPIERYICNIIDDIPAPPAGRVDVTYYLGEQPVSFRCPPSNEPNVWSGLPLFPLFECLSPENVLSLLALVLTERQILFISSQLSLLTTCAEAITSLIYPFSWTHAYIPILPTKLLGVLSAPFPFILGMHPDYLLRDDCSVGEETVRIYLDSNAIDYGILGPAPPLPERRSKKLLAQIIAAGRIFAGRGEEWKEMRVGHFDDAFSSVSEVPGCVWNAAPGKKQSVDESALRSGFLQFFVAVFQSYRKHLILGNAADPDPMVKFDCEKFLAESPADWIPLLSEMTSTQLFSQFIDTRTMESNNDTDVLFFDESIDAKMNRYTFRFRNFDTPFLQDNADKHAKTYVPPSPDVTNLADCVLPIVYSRFPTLNADLFSPPRGQPAFLAGSNMLAVAMTRLKRTNPSAPGGAVPTPLSATAAIFSCYLVLIARVVCLAQVQAVSHRVVVRPSIMQIIEEYGAPDPEFNGSAGSASLPANEAQLLADAISNPSLGLKDSEIGDSFNKQDLGSAAVSNGSGNSSGSTSLHLPIVRATSASVISRMKGRRRSDSADTFNAKSLFAAAKLALMVALEGLNALSKYDEPADDAVYRALVDACACCGFGREVIDIVVHMSDEGILPDNAMLSSVAKALAFKDENGLLNGIPPKVSSAGSEAAASVASNSLPNPADVWTMTDSQWRAVQRGSGVLYRRKMYGPAGTGPLYGGGKSPVPGNYANGNGGGIIPPSRSEADLGGIVGWFWGTSTNAPASSNRSAPPLPPTPATPTSSITIPNITSLNAQLAKDSLGFPSGDLPFTPPRPVRSEAGLNQAKRISRSIQNFPDLEWKNFENEKRKEVFVVSKKLRRHMIIAEDLLHMNFPGLKINIDHEIGMACPGFPGKPCIVGRAQTLQEIYSGWEVGDPNKYTCRCFACGREFVPRFTVEYDCDMDCASPDASARNGNPKSNSPLWCELLSPWTLRKELFNIILNEGVEYVISPNFRNASDAPQQAVLFWNAIIVFRLFGLPFSFLLTNKTITEAFPPKSK